ncbi:hypothetical protein I316_05570 [Kwoniella heveanensis BCC8398]|uniref:C2H2-type domain-containing protein n=1 Tax=Kwoniella heveanensis BCC8398 TaxID=1296120 RepID=A0A1B9GNH9_9TREE|nr:hypothetical protein I316_05570 [Kwoniella heveanensis BCC8398]
MTVQPNGGGQASGSFEQWRSPPPQQTPLVEPSSLPGVFSPNPPADSPSLNQVGKNDLLHPSFLPPCEHGKDDGDMHAHAFDLLSLSSGAKSESSRPPLPATKSTSTTHAVPSSVPAHITSFLSASRPPAVNGSGHGHNISNGSSNGLEKKEGPQAPPKARRMSSSTTGVLGRGKLGLTGAGDGGLGLGGLSKDNRTSSYSGSTTIPNRRPTISNGSPTPQLFDFAKTDRRPSAPQIASRTASAVPASLPVRGHLHSRSRHEDDIELDMEFDADDDDEGEGSRRSGSADIEMDMDEDDGEIKGEWDKLALGTGSGGVKGRRKGMVFKCETCSKEYRHPSCLVKHRWEHSPHWKEPTALSMSKHQQVQMLEAAAILAHLDPTANSGRSLPTDKSLWPAILGADKAARSSPRSARDPSLLRSPPSSVIAPLTPSSLREPLSLGSVPERMGKERKSSPGSDSTTSSMGAGEPYIPQNGNGAIGVRNGNGYTNGHINGNGHASVGSPHMNRSSRPMGINPPPAAGGRRHSSSISSIHGPGTPHSVGSLPDMAGLNFHSGTTPTGSHHGMSPIPNRNTPLFKAGMIGGGMFGAVHTAVPSSSVRSGAADLPEDDEEDEDDNWANARGRGKSSSEEAEGRRGEGEEWAGMASEMEL